MKNHSKITGIILAGGKSSRIGSDKGFILLNGSTFISYIIETLKPFVEEIIIVSNNSDYDVFGHKRVHDIINNAGPLAGLYSGLYHSKNENNLVLSCDVPMINSYILKKLINEVEEKIDIVQIQSQNRTMPLIAIYKKHCKQLCLKLLESGERRLKVAVEQLNTKTVMLDIHLEKYIRNINTKEQLKTLRHEFED